MRVVFLMGPIASGKGTQAQKLADSLGYNYLSTGDMLRDIKDDKPDVAKTMEEGKLIPDEELIVLLLEYLEKKEIYDNFILDGSPRSVYQYQKIDEKLKSLYLLQIKLDTISFLMTLSWEAKHLPHSAYARYVEQSTEIGRRIGGWRKGLETKLEPKTPHNMQGE